jgi:hypothetical protein
MRANCPGGMDFAGCAPGLSDHAGPSGVAGLASGVDLVDNDLGQMTEIAMLAALPWLLRYSGAEGTLAAGTSAWFLRFFSLALGPPLWLAVSAHYCMASKSHFLPWGRRSTSTPVAATTSVPVLRACSLFALRGWVPFWTT